MPVIDPLMMSMISNYVDTGDPPPVSNIPSLRVKKLHPDAKLPVKAHEYTDLGYDLSCVENIPLAPLSVTLVDTGIACGFPNGWGGLLRDRSSLASKRGLFVVAGVIDNGYSGPVKVAVYNSNNEWEHFDAGERIAQMIPIRVNSFSIIEVDELEETDRNGDGFGSSCRF